MKEKIAAQTNKNQTDTEQTEITAKKYTKNAFYQKCVITVSEGPLGSEVRTTDYDEEGNIWESVDSQIDGKRQIKETLYNPNGVVIGQAVKSRKDGKYQVEETIYDENGNIIKQAVEAGESIDIWYKKDKQKNN